MPLQPGSQLGRYEIEAAIGAGGMGEVYRARDVKLGRRVAIKSLPATFARDPERVARFEREAQVLAALNHPHIASIYGVEDAGGSLFLVLELVEGQTLADVIRGADGAPGLHPSAKLGVTLSLPKGQARGVETAALPGAKAPGLHLNEALAIARQIVEALEAAHDKGIVHRDLKPANIAITGDGQVKVLDFGLAKYQAPDDGSIDPANSPTLTFAATQAGMILGTAAYMSPEQAKGRAADRRSDVWAFGCVLFEMLSGRRAFEGEDVSDLLAAVLRSEPDWSLLPADVPDYVRTLLKRCLEKDRRARIPDFSVVRFMLDDATATQRMMPVTDVAAAPAPARWRAALPWAVAAVFALALAVAVAWWAPWKAPVVSPPVRLSIDLGTEATMPLVLGANAILSPDGRVLVFMGQAGPTDAPKLFVRRLDQLQSSPLAGTDSAFNPFFSPDGQWVAFFAQGKLKKLSVTGGAAVTLCDAANGRGGSWGDGDTIVFQPGAGAGTPLQRVSAAGGAPVAAFPLAEGEAFQRWPQVLPGGQAVVFTSSAPGVSNFESSDIVVQGLDGKSRKVLVRGGFYGRYLESGHLLYQHEGTIFAVAFDPGKLEVTGSPVPAIERVASAPPSGGVQFAASASGTVVYAPGDTLSTTTPILWMDRKGMTPLRAQAADWSNPRFSPDGTKLAVDVSDGTQTDIWIYEWARDTFSRLTFDNSNDTTPIWTPDGQRIVFASQRADQKTLNLYWQRADGTGEVQRLTESPNVQRPWSWHPSGKFLAFTEQSVKTSSDLMALPLEGDERGGWKPGKAAVFLGAPYTESAPMFSPDGRWISYLSNESGRIEVYVRPFPGPGGKWQVSSGGGDDNLWSAKRPELFFADGDLRMMVAPYSVQGDSFRAEKPQVWSTQSVGARPRAPSRDVDLHPDGERFAVGAGDNAAAGRERRDRIVVVFNFFDELKRLTAR